MAPPALRGNLRLARGSLRPSPCSFLALATAAAAAVSEGIGVVWPPDVVQRRTRELENAGRRAATWVACPVCEALAFSVAEEMRKNLLQLEARGEDLDGDDMEEMLGGPRELCKMSRLAKLMRAQGLEVATHENNASASLLRRRDNRVPLYTDKLEEGAFHYKSFGVQRACTRLFRLGFEQVAGEVAAAYRRTRRRPEVEVLMAIGSAGRTGCLRAPACLEERNRRGDSGHLPPGRGPRVAEGAPRRGPLSPPQELVHGVLGVDERSAQAAAARRQEL